MSDSVQISVVIPTYNRAPLIARAIESVLRQTRKADEIIVVDDGSTDDTRERMTPYLGSLRYLFQKNAGASASRNHGVEEARFPWVAFLDSDDIWMESHLERMAHAIDQTNGRAGFYFSDMALAPEEGGGTLWGKIGFHFDGPFLLANDAVDWVLKERQPTMLQSAVFNKIRYLASGGLWLPLRLTHDTHLFMKLGIGGPACAVAGCGTIQTSDDAAGTRLTEVHSGEKRERWEEAVMLWQDTLANTPTLSSRSRGILRFYLSHAHWRLSRQAWTHRHFGRSIADGVRAFVASPKTVFQILVRAPRRSTLLS